MVADLRVAYLDLFLGLGIDKLAKSLFSRWGFLMEEQIVYVGRNVEIQWQTSPGNETVVDTLKGSFVLCPFLRKSSACPKDMDIIVFAFAPFDFQILPLKLFVRNGWN